MYRGQHARLDIIGSVTIRILAGFANGFSVISDILIAAGLCYYLSTGRTGFKRQVRTVALSLATSISFSDKDKIARTQ